jgi:hypothetical protein
MQVVVTMDIDTTTINKGKEMNNKEILLKINMLTKRLHRSHRYNVADLCQLYQCGKFSNTGLHVKWSWSPVTILVCCYFPQKTLNCGDISDNIT